MSFRQQATQATLTALAVTALSLTACSPGAGRAATSPGDTRTGTPTATAPTIAPGGTTGNYAQRSNEFVARCMSDAGWRVTLLPDGVSAEVPPEQQNAYGADLDGCNAAFKQANPIAPLTRADYVELYRQEIVTMKCLEKNGYPPVDGPISQQQYVDSSMVGGLPAWTAYSAVMGGDLSIEKTCPQPFLERFR